MIMFEMVRQCPICEQRKAASAFHVKPGGELSRGCKRCVLSPTEQREEIKRLNGIARAENW